MTTEARPAMTDLLKLTERRMAWLEARQRVLAGNIANADTPGYQPRDVRSFASVLSGAGGGPPMAATNPRHLAARTEHALAQPDRSAPDRAPNGNAVSLDREALKVAETDSAHSLAAALHRRYLGMFRTALGRQG
ncbi:MAG: flagellar biosynthesis protein FlgB [Acetobacteraceae bacterium]|jgi:flagellar basal-body rod protein FlgB|nr:flagellar biosynthesis protein FlgB [Acetobacteraceae bacterium]